MMQKNRTFHFVMTAFLCIGMGTAWLSWQIHQSYQTINRLVETDAKMLKLHGEILRLDELLTLLSRIAVTTGDLHYVERYDELFSQLDKAIIETLELSPASIKKQVEEQTYEANLTLLNMEKKALKLVREGKKEVAYKIVFSDKYEQAKMDYSKGMDILSNYVTNMIQHAKEEKEEGEKIIPVVIIVLAFLLIVLILIIRYQIKMHAQLLDTHEHIKTQKSELKKANQEIGKLNDNLKEENIRLGAEIEAAKKIQMMVILDEKDISYSGVDISMYLEPAEEVGGDYYDIISDIQSSSVRFGIGDVTGHGLESGVIMLMVQTAMKTLMVHGELDLIKVYETINKVICDNVSRIKSEKSMTLSLLDYNFEKHIFSVTGQHEDILLIKTNGEYQTFSTMDLGLPIGLDYEISDFTEKLDIHLENNHDILILHTDGVTEAENMKNEQYGFQRMCDIVNKHRQLTAKQIKQYLIDDVLSHIGEQKIFDDITLLIIKRDDATKAA